MSNFKVKYSDESLYKLSKIENYVLLKFNENVLEQLMKKLDKELEYITKNPLIFKNISDTERISHWSKHYSILFRIEKNEIIILDFIITKSANDFYF